jgi:hypothetical protein
VPALVDPAINATPTDIIVEEIPPTDTPMPEPTSTETPTPEPTPTETPTPEPPTNTPPPPPPPTNTPAPPPPPDTPAPPPPTPVPANTGPQVVIELPKGDKFDVGNEVQVIITVRDSDGVTNFEWGVFTENGVSVKGANKKCDNRSECSVEEKFKASLEGTFQIGVDAKDTQGNKTIETKQIYISK